MNYARFGKIMLAIGVLMFCIGTLLTIPSFQISGFLVTVLELMPKDEKHVAEGERE